MPIRRVHGPAILLGAFAGLRLAEACGLRVSDVDFMRGLVSAAVQYPAEPLKTGTSRAPVPISHSVALELSAHVAKYGGETILANEYGRQLSPWTLERAIRAARGTVPGLPPTLRFQDCRSLLRIALIASGDDVEVVQASTRAAIEAAMAARADYLRTAWGA